MRFTYDDRKKEVVVPMRFVWSCTKGHVDDIDWVAFAHMGEKTCARNLWFEEGGTSGDLSEIQISCDCGKSQSLAMMKSGKRFSKSDWGEKKRGLSKMSSLTR
jgi:hypothetical protein